MPTRTSTRSSNSHSASGGSTSSTWSPSNSSSAELPSASASDTSTGSQSRATSSPSRSRTGSATAWRSASWSISLSRTISQSATLRLLPTHTVTIPVPPPLPAMTYFSFTQDETIALTVITAVVMVSFLISIRLSVMGARDKRRRRAPTPPPPTLQLSAKQLEGFDDDEDADIAFDEFDDRHRLNDDDPVNYVVPISEHGTSDAQLVAQALREQHPVFGVPVERAENVLLKRIGSASPRAEKLQREAAVHERVVIPSLASADRSRDDDARGATTIGAVNARSHGVELMHTTKQVPSVDVEELPWVTPDEATYLRDEEALEQNVLLEQSGRTARKMVAERQLLDVVDPETLERASSFRSLSPTSAVARSPPRRDVDAISVIQRASSVRGGPVDEAAARRSAVGTERDSLASSSHSAMSKVWSYRGLQQRAQSMAAELRSPSARTDHTDGGAGGLRWGEAASSARTAHLFQYSSDPGSRIRNIQMRVNSAPLRAELLQGNAVATDKPPKPVTIHGTHMLPDVDDETFAGIDLDRRLLDNDL